MWTQRHHDEIVQKLDHVHELLHHLTERIITLSAETDRLTASVAALTTVEQSAVTLLGQLSQLIRDNAQDPAALNALADSIDDDKNDLAAAVSANTPAA